jgi:hypothetical protein
MQEKETLNVDLAPISNEKSLAVYDINRMESERAMIKFNLFIGKVPK